MGSVVIRATFVALLATGCQINLDHPATADAQTACMISTTAPSCLDAVGHMELSWIQPNVFTKNCALTGCHDGSTTQPAGQDPNLTDGQAYASLVGRASVLDTTRMIVVPSDVNSSYLALMLGIVKPGDATPPGMIPSQGTMPMSSGLLCCQKLDAIQAWVQAGAPNN